MHTTMQTRSRSSKSPPNSVSAGDPSTVRTYAYWDEKEEAELIKALASYRSDMVNNNFKDPVFTAVAADIAPYYVKGAVKDMKMCKLKWKTVCTSHLLRVLCVLTSLTR
jgi:hypothetical protein